MEREQVSFNIDGLPVRITHEFQYHERLTVVPMHIHDELEILVGNTGRLEIDAHGERIEIGEGDAAIIGRRVPHLTRKLQPYTTAIMLQLRLESPILDAAPSLSLLAPECEKSLTLLPAADPRAEKLGHLISCIRAESMERQESYRHFIRGHVSLLLGTLYRSGILSDPALRTDNTALEKLRPALAYIDGHYGSEITLGELSETVHLTPEYFCRLFKQATNLSPVEYINRVRIFKAEQLLLSTDATVTDIAFKVGFSQASYFNRIFHRYRGMTPSEYRKIIYSQNKLM